MQVLFLGTGSMVPTPERNTSGMVVSHRDEHVLIDCGEGTQKQMRMAKFSPAKVTRILITHWHGDHVFGLPGLLSTISQIELSHPIQLYGPPGTKKFLKVLFSSYINLNKLPLKVHECKEGFVFETKEFKVEAKKMAHTSLCYAYAFIEKDKRSIDMEYVKKFGLTSNPILKELQAGKDITWNKKKIKAKDATIIKKGKKLAVIFDTMMCKEAVAIAKNADVLICESTLDASLKELAKSYKHLTCDDAASVAKKANVKQLVLTHFSQRYNDVRPLEDSAKKIFPKTIVARDFAVIDV